MKAEIGIVGHFGGNQSSYDGQTIKTIILYNELKKRLGNDQVLYIDTYNWKRNVFKTLINSIKLSLKCKKIIINTSNKGRYFFIPLYYLLKKFTDIKIYCMVIGGGFPKQMEKNKLVSNIGKKLDGIYVETNTMLHELELLGYQNVSQLNNFKKLNIIKKNDLNCKYTLPLKICTFSRVIKEKGIEDIIEAVVKLNTQKKEVVYSLDIYGQIGDEYKNEFEEQVKLSPDYVRYRGIVEYDKSVETLRNYFLVVFPTRYKTEGVPGTIIDSYAAGVPVIASNWDSYRDVIENNVTGMIFRMGDVDDLVNRLEQAYEYPEKIIKMKKNCLDKALAYSSDAVISEFLGRLEYDI